ncbi:8-amino-7-oxononanoate synthase [Massilia antarctica]|uniref:8-amino-7-oxononanoate synthase n=1 Tax=Massilia antarctica TaxID=2765360 RepID=UPI0006BB860B|nr:8-amino-7-oxononanoate synthase [Massilia sp. H27-R4]MCY0915756.1 8-amino-7-oxononanoate synthase [Massilia sp. H27-R4]CUI06201.1 8-amino-7-oxononanoate synthase [Janthinobacterium sp. CG23_2]CUU29987.1 8-amino-7-oxononanoate synthase [Janthinobacterium sp. CG23_2]
MKLIDAIERQLRQFDEQSLTRERRVVDTPCKPRLTVNGRPLLAFASNDYLGLAAHPRVVEALREGADLYGAGSGASHLISGHSVAHQRLEERLAGFVGPHLESPRTLSFCTGYMANLAILTALGADGDAQIFSESLNHASLIDGARLARAAVKVYPHADLAALGAMLAASNATAKLVVTDSVFSMDGDIAPLPELLALCEQHDAWLVIDDAHGFGVLGAHGRGALEHFNLRSPNIVYMGTLGKAAGVGGAFVAAHASVIELMIQRGRPYIYTTAAPPALAHALLTSIDIIGGDEGASRRAHLQSLIAAFDEQVDLKHWQRVPSSTAIQAIVIGTNEEVLRIGAGLHGHGLWVPAIRPPTVPEGTARLRVTLSAAHTHEEVAQLAAVLNDLERT